ncbi:hypothetical protein DdX_09486 [Ditylenchus destructor]|uniref:Uncharacterized protein n=1 Tax=Ditylenchus destructor TaxID=166010 RepID=A0AAD4N2R0_9BILA|nr:hypothetical protein DdX_09486 [Ditylenchus destructor]
MYQQTTTLSTLLIVLGILFTLSIVCSIVMLRIRQRQRRQIGALAARPPKKAFSRLIITNPQQAQNSEIPILIDPSLV